jgi:poly [ADP-ribose] polymerase
VVKLICSKDLLNKTLLDLSIDVDRFPLGKLSKAQVSKGYNILTQLHEALNEADNRSTIVTLSNSFYTLIPHNFGMKLPPAIDNLELLTQKIQLIEALGQIEIANSVLREAARGPFATTTFICACPLPYLTHPPVVLTLPPPSL